MSQDVRRDPRLFDLYVALPFSVVSASNLYWLTIYRLQSTGQVTKPKMIENYDSDGFGTPFIYAI